MDENDDKDFTLEVKNHRNILENYVGEHLRDNNSFLILAYFKGHPLGGLEGVVKQLSIGFASRGGKSHIYRGGWIHKKLQRNMVL